ncbi:MAG: 2-keto-3-deoxygluconate permease [Erysipelotrichaceae bacterium]|jgi:2-keto-3-deoxygluconate permease
MYKAINKIPAGMFLVPMIVSMLLISFFPNMYSAVGGTMAELFDHGTGVIIGLLVFAAGTTIEIKSLVPLLKRHLPMILFKTLWSALLLVIFFKVFGMEGFLGINILAFGCVIFSLNPAVAFAIHSEYGDKNFGGVYGLYGIMGMQFAPMIVLSLLTSGGDLKAIEWMPIISVFLPLILGLILGNLDPAFGEFFSPLMGKLLPFLGWNLGTDMNLFSAIDSGAAGIIMSILFMVLMLPLILMDKYVFKKNNGVDGAAIWNVAGMSIGNPAAIAMAFPLLFGNQVESAMAIVAMACIITSILSPLIAQKLSQQN